MVALEKNILVQILESHITRMPEFELSIDLIVVLIIEPRDVR